jgi:acetyltransferase-like isoleucine patch superfamily enzyme
MALFDRLYMHWYHRFWKKHLLHHLQNKPKNISVLGPSDIMSPKVTAGDGCSFGNGVYFRGRPNAKVALGTRVMIGDNVTFMTFASISVGENTMIASNVYITDVNHGTAKGAVMRFQETTQKEVIIGKDVWVGTGVTILKGSIIHDGAVIGAGAVVDGEIPENAIAVGVPAKVIKYRQ